MDTINFNMALDNYSFVMKQKCLKHRDKNPVISFSFLLEGNFLKASLSDNIKDTIDYFAICQSIKKLFSKSIICEDSQHVLKVKSLIENYSLLINGGYIDFAITCDKKNYEIINRKYFTDPRGRYFSPRS